MILHKQGGAWTRPPIIIIISDQETTMEPTTLALPLLGIDVSKKTFNVVLLRNEKKKHKQFANHQPGFAELSDWLGKQGVAQVWACLEATGSYTEALACYLHQAGHKVSLVSPARIKAYGQSQLRRTKNDRADADLIARFCHDTRPRFWTPPPTEQRELQALVRHLDDLIETRQQLQNRFTDGPQISAVLDSLRQLIARLDEQIKEIEQQIKRHLDNHPDLKQAHDLLVSIKSVGTRTATVLLGEIERLRQYRQSEEVVAYAGLNPKQRQSGTSIKGKTCLSKTGNARVRKALYLPAVNAIQYNPIVKRLAERLEKRGLCRMAIIGAAMRKLLQLAFGVLKTGKPFYENHAFAS
jgi:transposase